MRLTAPGTFIYPSFSTYGLDACFAGGDGEFVVGCSRETNRIFIWSPLVVSDHQHNGQVQPLVTLKHEFCNQVRYNEARCILASYDCYILKLWTPLRLPEPITSNSGDDGGSTSRSDQEDVDVDVEMSSSSEEDQISSDEGGDDEEMDVSYVTSNSGRWRIE